MRDCSEVFRVGGKGVHFLGSMTWESAIKGGQLFRGHLPFQFEICF
jgi:hypothetical protein